MKKTAKKTITDPFKKAIDARIAELELDLKSVSLELGFGDAYVHQFLNYDKPKKLDGDTRDRLADILGFDRGLFHLLAQGDQSVLSRLWGDGAPITDLKRTADFDLSSRPKAKQAQIDEVHVRGGAGDGGITEIEHLNAPDQVRATWGIPSEYIRSELLTGPSDIRIIAIQGDSMHPTLQSGDRALVDTGDKRPSPPGIFALWDGYGVIVKRVELVPMEKPPKMRVISDNQLHRAYEIEPDEHTIIGRIVGMIRRM